MTFEDKPEPGFDYIAMILLTNIGSLIIFLWQFIEREILNETGEMIWMVAMAASVLFVTGKAILGAYRTVYRLEDDKLILRKFRKEVTVELEHVVLVDMVSPLRSFVWFSKDFYYNRMSDLVRLKTDYKSYVLSPTNSQLFISHIRSLRYRQNQNNNASLNVKQITDIPDQIDTENK